MSLKKIIYIVMLLLLLISLIIGIVWLSKIKKNDDDNSKIKIVVSNFASYDFINAIIGENNSHISVKFLVGAGKDAHGFDPSAKDIVDIENADLFVYIGGEIEPWAQKIVVSSGIKSYNSFCIADYVDKQLEVNTYCVEQHEHEEDAFNYHIWTSPDNAKRMLNVLKDKISSLDMENDSIYGSNLLKYCKEIDDVDSMIKDVIKNKKRNILVFGDKMPMQYFITYYGLDAKAAFNGCSSESEPSSKTITYLTDLVKSNNIPVVLYTELNDGSIASIIANEAGGGTKTLKLQTLHNISLEDFKNGETWVSLMKRNVEVLKEALY